MTEKTCIKCLHTKNIDDFYFIKKSNNIIYRNVCKKCYCQKSCERWKEKDYGNTINRSPYIDLRDYDNNMKLCNTCKINKPLDLFYYCKNIMNYHSQCKSCKAEYVSSNREKINAAKKIYKQNNPGIRIRDNLQSRLSSLISKNIQSKTLIKYLGCDYKYFLEWIEYQFYDNMSFENYGSIWHIDHIKPCASFNLELESELLECYNWKNCRPAFKIDNLKKNCKVIPELIDSYSELASKFIKLKSSGQSINFGAQNATT